MALALKAMFTSGRYDAFFERTRGITGLNMKRSDFRFMNIVSFLRIESACLYAYSFHIFGWIRKKKNLFFGFFFLSRQEKLLVGDKNITRFQVFNINILF